MGKQKEYQNRLNTREELIELLDQYKRILSHSTINYLESLLNLEMSVIREEISISDRAILSNLDIYRQIALYNIYNRALKLFIQSELAIDIDRNEGLKCVNVYASLTNKDIKLFNFDYSEKTNKEIIIYEDYPKREIGNISLFQTIENEELRNQELLFIINKLHKLYDEKNLYSSQPNIYGGPAASWIFRHNQEIKEYEQRFEQLDGKKQLSEKEKLEIEITKHFHDLLFQDYGLTRESFEEDQNPYEQTTKLQQSLVRKMPDFNISDNLKYI